MQADSNMFPQDPAARRALWRKLVSQPLNVDSFAQLAASSCVQVSATDAPRLQPKSCDTERRRLAGVSVDGDRSGVDGVYRSAASAWTNAKAIPVNAWRTKAIPSPEALVDATDRFAWLEEVINAPTGAATGLASAVVDAMDGPRLPWEARQQILGRAARLGISRFDANLIIAAVLHRGAHANEAPPTASSVSFRRANNFAWKSVSVWVAGVLAAEVCAVVIAIKFLY